MTISKETFVAEYPPLVADGLRLRADAYDHVDGRRHIIFTAQGDDQPASVSSHANTTTRLGYRIHNGK